MAKAFSLAAWNVEHFKGDPDRVTRVVDFLATAGGTPDVFALFEVKGSRVYDALTDRLPGYSFHITEGRQVQEILVGVKRGMTSFFTQKTEFKSGSAYLRPGALLSVKVDGESYSVLFLHTKSKPDPKGMGLRDDMLVKACKFRRTLDKASQQAGNPKWSSNYIFLGDLNTMGMKYPYGHNIPATTELRKLDREAKKVKMRRLTKTHPETFSNGSGSRYPDSDLDQVVAAEHLRMKQFSSTDVRVQGWCDETTVAGRDKWIQDYSDHCLLYLEVQKV